MSLNLIKHRASKATKGPWRWLRFGGEYHLVADYGSRKIILQGGSKVDYLGDVTSSDFLMVRDDTEGIMRRLDNPEHHDAAFLAHARDDVDYLLSQVEELTINNQNLQELLLKLAERINRQSYLLSRKAEKA